MANNIITTEMLFINNIQIIIEAIKKDYCSEIQYDFDNEPNKYTDLFTWLEYNPKIVGKAFTDHLINYGITNDDIN